MKLVLRRTLSLDLPVKFCAQRFMVHAGRIVRNPGGSNPAVVAALERVRDSYRGRKRPTPLHKSVMEKRFDRFFGMVSDCADLDRSFERLKANRKEILRFLYKFGAPLHTSRIK